MTDNSPKKKNITIDADDNNPKSTDEQETPASDASGETNQPQETENPELLKKQLEEARQEADQERDRLLRLSAEFDNYKKRMNRQMEDFRKYANETLLKDLLSVVDNLERALNTSGENSTESAQACLIEGVEMTLSETLKILSKFNVTPIESVGKPFDPVFHEAVMQEERDDQPANTVINEFQKGYMIHDRLLRPSMVVVSKEKS